MKRLEMLQLAKVVINRTPADEVNLNVWECGTFHCSAGALSLSAEFNALGLTLRHDRFGAHPHYKGETGGQAMKILFNDPDAFRKYFDGYGYGRWDYEIKREWMRSNHGLMPPKALALARFQRGIEEEMANAEVQTA